MVLEVRLILNKNDVMHDGENTGKKARRMRFFQVTVDVKCNQNPEVQSTVSYLSEKFRSDNLVVWKYLAFFKIIAGGFYGKLYCSDAFLRNNSPV